MDFVGSPEMAADFNYAVPIMIWGMEEGMFSGRRLSEFINPSGADYLSARKIINGIDEKTLIASYASKFQGILKVTSVAPEGF